MRRTHGERMFSALPTIAAASEPFRHSRSAPLADITSLSGYTATREEAIARWKASPRTTRGGQPLFSNMAIQTGLILRTVFGLALRQTEGLIGSIIHSAGDRACSTRPFHARPARSNSDLAKVDAPSCWVPAIDCRQHGSEAEWSRRMAGRKAWNNKAPLMAQIAYRLGRSLWRDCR